MYINERLAHFKFESKRYFLKDHYTSFQFHKCLLKFGKVLSKENL